MGQEIGYCFKCQKRVSSAELDKGRGSRQEGRWLCEDCSPDAPSDAAERARPDNRSGTTRIPRVSAPPSPAPAGKPPLLWIGGGLGVAAIAAFFLLRGSPAEPVPVPVERTPRREAPPEESSRERAAKEALAKARAIGGGDLDRQIAAYLAAMDASAGTSFQTEARETYTGLLAIRRAAYVKELSAEEPQIQGFVNRQEFKAAFDLVETLRKRRAIPDWTDLVQQRSAQVRAAEEQFFVGLRDRAADAKRRSLKAELATLRERVRKSGLPERIEELDRILAGVAVESDDRPWRALFDGRSNAFLSSHSKAFWRVEDGALVCDPKENQAGQSGADIPDGELRIRFQAKGVDRLFFSVRQGIGSYMVNWNTPQFAPLDGLACELVFMMKGESVRATLNGTAVEVTMFGKPEPAGRLQFNGKAASFRITAVEHRPLPE